MEDLISHNGTLAGSHNGVHAPSSVPVYSPQRQMRGIAIVGLGYWGPNWVRNFSQIQGIEHVVCCDFSRPRLDHIKGRYPSVVVTEQLDRVLADPLVDAVVVATPVNTHFEIASRCLKAGKSTLVEKPLSTSTEQAEQLIKMARERDLTLMSGHTFEDIALLTLRFPNNVIAFVHVSWLDPNKIRRTTIVGSRKMLVYDDTALQEKVRVYDKGVTKQPYYDTYGDFQLSYRYGDVNIPRIEDSEPLKVECDHFVDCITRGVSPNSDGLSGLRVVKVLEAADRSLKNHGQPIAVTPTRIII